MQTVTLTADELSAILNCLTDAIQCGIAEDEGNLAAYESAREKIAAAELAAEQNPT